MKSLTPNLPILQSSDQMANLIKYLKNQCQSFSSSPKNTIRGKSTLKSILKDQHYPDTKARQRHYKKRKLQANIIEKI